MPMPLRLRKSGQAGVPLLEIVLLVGVLVGLAWFASNAMRKARQRAVLAILKPRGISGEFDKSGWLIGLDGRGIPDDQFSLNEFRGLRDIPVLNLDHTEATDESLTRLPTALGLQELSLIGTAIGDAGCQEIARHQALTKLDVRLTFVSDDGVQTLATLKQLQSLRLAQTWVTDIGLASLINMPRLAVLDLRDTAVTDDGLSTLARLPALRQLLLKNSDVTAEGVARLRSERPDVDVEFSAGIDESVTVRLREPNINPDVLESKHFFPTAAEGAQLKQLIGLPISLSVEFRNGWASFVWADAKPNFNDGHFELLTRFRQLERLSVSFPNGSVTDAGVAHLLRNRMLRQLSLIGTEVTDEGLVSVARLPRLTHLWLDGHAISEEGLRTLSEARRLSWLGLSRTSFTPDAIRQLSALELKSLELRDAGIGEAELQAIGELDNLEQLDVSQNSFLGPGLQYLAKLKSLKRLDLSQTAVTDEDAQELLNFSDTLRDVVLTRSRVSPAVVAKLRDSGREWEITMIIPKIKKD
jgi:Leucine-rich repeat (LRR) protein